jgi:hypothetical protein
MICLTVPVSISSSIGSITMNIPIVDKSVLSEMMAEAQTELF